MTDSEKKERKRLYDIEYRKKNREKLNDYKKKWAEENPDKIKEIRLKNKENKKVSDKKWAQKNKEKLNDYKKKWAEKNKEKVKLSNAKYHKNKMRNNNIYKLKHIISNIIRDSLKRKGHTKRHKSFDILGCDIIEFKKYIESKFEPWMNWENYGNPEDGIFEINKNWDIDHIIPLKNATTEEDIIRLNHYMNLQPLCSYHNRFIKKDKIENDN
jgi:superfamily II DNA/RNA helicase